LQKLKREVKYCLRGRLGEVVVVVVAPVFCRAVATTIRVQKVIGEPEKLPADAAANEFCTTTVGSTELNPNSGLNFSVH
jgi:hypothetical protein